MKLTNLLCLVGLTSTVGCVHSHRTAHYAEVPATPTSTRPAVRVYQPPSTTVVTPPPVTVTPSTPAVITTVPSTPVITAPSTPVITTTPTVVTPTVTTVPSVVVETPPGVVTTATTGNENLAMAENIRRLLAADDGLNSAARNVRISIYNGLVTMTGRTVTQLERERLHSAITGLPGVYRVDDRIQVDINR